MNHVTDYRNSHADLAYFSHWSNIEEDHTILAFLKAPLTVLHIVGLHKSNEIQRISLGNR